MIEAKKNKMNLVPNLSEKREQEEPQAHSADRETNVGRNVPKLRFPGFEGEWEKHTLGEVGEPYIGLTYSPADVVSEGGVIVFRSSNIQNGEIDYSDIVRVEKRIKDTLRTRKDDLLICARNGSPRLIGKNTLLGEEDANQTFGAFMLVFRSKDNHFIHQLLSTKSYYSQVSENLGARINQITTANIKDFEFSFPVSKSERDKIASLLDMIDQRISIQSKIIERYESLIKAITKILISSSSKRFLLHEIADIYQPQTITASLLSADGEYPVYGANGIIGKYRHYNHTTSQICITCRGNTCGTINYSLPYSWITGNSMVINVDKYSERVNKRYLYHLLSTIDYTPYISGSGQPQIVRSSIAKIPLSLPPISNQITIASVLDTMVKKRELEKDLQGLFAKQKKELLRSLFI